MAFITKIDEFIPCVSMTPSLNHFTIIESSPTAEQRSERVSPSLITLFSLVFFTRKVGGSKNDYSSSLAILENSSLIKKQPSPRIYFHLTAFIILAG